MRGSTFHLRKNRRAKADTLLYTKRAMKATHWRILAKIFCLKQLIMFVVCREAPLKTDREYCEVAQVEAKSVCAMSTAGDISPRYTRQSPPGLDTIPPHFVDTIYYQRV